MTVSCPTDLSFLLTPTLIAIRVPVLYKYGLKRINTYSYIHISFSWHNLREKQNIAILAVFLTFLHIICHIVSISFRLSRGLDEAHAPGASRHARHTIKRQPPEAPAPCGCAVACHIRLPPVSSLWQTPVPLPNSWTAGRAAIQTSSSAGDCRARGLSFVSIGPDEETSG